MSDVAKIYGARFLETGLAKRNRVWQTLCKYYFQKYIPPHAAVLDLACGYGEFINNIVADQKFAVDLNRDAPRYLGKDVRFFNKVASDLSDIEKDKIDVVFTSNFLEHLRDKSECDRVMKQVLEVLKPGGLFMILGPNIRYAYAEYWDYYDHYLPLSHLSLAEGLATNGFEVGTVIPRFLPYTMKNSVPTHPILIRGYLGVPLAWRFLGKQFLGFARKPKA
jgi:SAM-dependent methyltransferase